MIRFCSFLYGIRLCSQEASCGHEAAKVCNKDMEIYIKREEFTGGMHFRPLFIGDSIDRNIKKR